MSETEIDSSRLRNWAHGYQRLMLGGLGPFVHTVGVDDFASDAGEFPYITAADVLALLDEVEDLRAKVGEARAEALQDAGRQAERLRQSNPINGDCSNSTLTRLQNALVAMDQSARDAILDERARIQARRDEDYLRLCAENDARRADGEAAS